MLWKKIPPYWTVQIQDLTARFVHSDLDLFCQLKVIVLRLEVHNNHEQHYLQAMATFPHKNRQSKYEVS